MIKAENVVKIFNSRAGVIRAVDGVSTEVAQGEVVVVIGPSGSGKSTFLRCINGLEAFTEGHIIIDGVDLADKKTNINKVRAEVGMVFQQFNLFPHKTVVENLTLAQRKVRKRSHKEAEEKAYALLKKVGIHDKAGEYPSRLSGGQQQRTAICRALLQGGEAVLGDEPVSAADNHQARAIMDALCERFNTVILAMHDVELALQYTDRIIGIKASKIALDCPTDGLTTADIDFLYQV